jgi:hypothetical protein
MSTRPATRLADPERRLHEAWAVHCGLILAERVSPTLRDNPQWKLLRMDAYETFHNLLTVPQDGR